MNFSLGKIVPAFLLFDCTAVAEILGCYFPYLILKQGKSAWLWMPAILSLAIFVWLLTLHPAASGGIYIFTALFWLHFVDQVALTRWDLLGRLVVWVSASLMILQPHGLIR